jgi:DNA-binding LacI/PurR family transcriptional regulator
MVFMANACVHPHLRQHAGDDPGGESNRMSKNTPGSISIKDVAAALGVSATTVSRALRDRPGMSAETQRRIKDEAERLGYVPNLAGSALSTGRTRSILYVVPYNSGRFPSLFQMDVLEGLVDEVSGHGYTVSLVTERYLRNRQASVFEVFRTFRADGAAVLLLSANEPAAPPTNFAMPVVIINKMLDVVPADFVVADDEAGAYNATRHLIDLGHTRIAHVAGLPDNYNSLRRIAGYRRALLEAGLPVDDGMIVESAASRDMGYAAVLKLFDRMPPFTALFCNADEIALGALRALRESSLSVPHDVALVSFDDDTFADVVEPPLTTVRKPRYGMGRAAGELLVQRLNGTLVGAPKTLSLRTTLIRRASCGHLLFGFDQRRMPLVRPTALAEQ